MTFYADDKVMTPGETTLEIEELEGVIAPKRSLNRHEALFSDEVELAAEEPVGVIAPQITSSRTVIFAYNGLELGFEESEETLKRNDLTEKEKS